VISKDKADSIRALADENGYIEPQTVVDAARRPSHPLHKDFDWNVQSAAQAHWLDTARKLIRYVRVEFVTRDLVINSVAYVSDPQRPPKSKRYVDLTVAATQKGVAREILLDEMQRIVAQIRRARQICAVLGLTAQLDALLADVDSLMAAAETATARASEHGKRKGRKGKGKRKQEDEARV
jgi:hypothetical protein